MNTFMFPTALRNIIYVQYIVYTHMYVCTHIHIYTYIDDRHAYTIFILMILLSITNVLEEPNMPKYAF